MITQQVCVHVRPRPHTEERSQFLFQISTLLWSLEN